MAVVVLWLEALQEETDTVHWAGDLRVFDNVVLYNKVSYCTTTTAHYFDTYTGEIKQRVYVVVTG